MGKAEQVAWERRVGRYIGVAAASAAFLQIVALVVYSSDAVKGLDTGRNDELLFRVHDKPGPFWLSTILASIGIALAAPVLSFLYRAIRFRRPQIPRVALVLAVAGPLAVGALGVAQQAELTHVAAKFAKHPDPPPVTQAEKNKLAKITDPKKYQDEVDKLGRAGRADHLLSTGPMAVIRGIGIVTNLILAGAFVLIGLHGMRAGLYSRFLGILGIIIGVLYVVPLLGTPAILEFFWLIAIALLVLDRWPQTRGAAWDTGEPIPWPTAEDRRAEMEAKRAGKEPPPPRRPAAEAATADGGGPEDAEGEPAAAGAPTATAEHPRSKKRKRKRRN